MYRHIPYLFPCMEESTLPLLVAVGLRHSFSMDILILIARCQILSPTDTGAPSHFINSQLVRLILEKYLLFRLSKVDLGNCILSKVLLKTRKLGNMSTKN